MRRTITARILVFLLAWSGALARSDDNAPAPPDPAPAAPAEAQAPSVAAPEPAPPGTDDSSPFPRPAEIESNVSFWKDIFAKWSRQQVVLHDDEHPSLVYEVIQLPGPPSDVYSKSQREFVRVRRESFAARLRRLEQRVASGHAVDDDEKELVIRIATHAGTDGLRGASERVRSQRGLRERFLRGLEISGRYEQEFRRIFREAGLPEDLAYLPHVESSFQAAARSSAGAVGVWQFTRGAARRFMALDASIDERLDPVASARGAAGYLADAYATLGDWALAVTSYNHGVEGMSRAKERYGTDFGRIVREYDGRAFGFASRNFYAEFLAAREIAAAPGAFFPEGIRPEPPLRHDRVTLDRRMPPVQVARTYGVPLAELAAINPAWSRRAVRGGLALPAGTTVWLPERTLGRSEGSSSADTRPTPSPARPQTQAPPVARDGSSFDVTQFLLHVVRRGESLFKIAASYGVRVSDLLGLNRLEERSILQPGQKLLIPRTR